MNYQDFLKSKIKLAPESGFAVDPSSLNPILKPHERDSVIWMVKGGRRALFSSFGMGKTVTQLEALRVIMEHNEGKALIIAPLAVVHVFQDDAERLLNIMDVPYIKTMQEAKDATAPILITNYERVRDGDIDPSYFTACSLDEASVLRSLGEIIKSHGLSSINAEEKLARSIGVMREEVKGKKYTAVYNDNVAELPNIADNSVDLIHTSIPFSNHYEYTPSYNDFGHNEDNVKFFEQMDYLTPELLRVLKPGRVAAIHVKDRILFGNATGTGMPTVDPFSDITTAHFMKHGFQYMGRITVVTDVVRENNQTYRLGWTEQCKDGTKMGVGCPEYVLLFRKLPSDTSRAYADHPVIKSKIEYTRAQWQIDAHAFWKSSGNSLITMDELKETPVSDLQARYREYSRNTLYNYREHVNLANELEEEHKLPSSFMVVAPGSNSEWVWDDVNRMRTLNGEQSRKELTMHICPLQFDIVERIINRYSDKNDLVLDPFAGLMTVPYMAVKMGRRGYGIELNHESFHDGCRYLKDIDMEVSAPTLFELLEGFKNELVS